MQHPLSGKVVIITGASSGIGAATARALADLGCKLTLTARSTDKLYALAQALGPTAMAAPADISDNAAILRLVEQTVKVFGRIDVLFANAGLYIPGEVAQGNPDDWAKLIDVNVNGVFRCVSAVLPHMLAQKSGDILITSSIAGVSELRGEPVYGASKHALQVFVHTFRRQVAASGIRVGSIAPGTVANELWGYTDPAEIDKQIAQRTAIRSEDVAQAAIFMLSQPPHITIRDLVILPQAQDI
jgi:ribitol 2-dehydrogenase